jgi:hypothetical protein
VETWKESELSIDKRIRNGGMNWSKILEEVDRAHPFESRLAVTGAENNRILQVPAVLRLSTAIAINTISSDKGKRVGLVFPKVFDAAKWIAAGTGLAGMLADSIAGLKSLPPLTPGDLLLGDGRYIVEYLGTDSIKGAEFLKLRLGGDTKASYSIPIRERLRLQHVATRRPLSGRPMPRSAPDPLDSILEIHALGNRSIYQSSIVLVSSLGETREWGQKSFVAPYQKRSDDPVTPLLNLFQWGGIDQNGVADNWGRGQFKGQPVVAVASDLLAVEKYLTGDCAEIKMIIVEGAERFSRDLQSLDEILDSGVAVLAVIDVEDTKDAALLAERDFAFWEWTKEDLSDPLSGINAEENMYGKPSDLSRPFSLLTRALRNFRDSEISETNCSDEHLNRAEPALFEFERQIRPDQEELKALVGALYGCMLNIARLLRPRGHSTTVQWRHSIEERLNWIDQELNKNKIWLTAPVFAIAQTLIHEMRLAVAAEPDESKVKALREIITQQTAMGANLVGIVVGNEEDVGPTAQYWEENLSDYSKVVFSSASTLDEALEYDALVVCGWLGATKMSKLLHAYVAPEVYVLVNQFERRWLRSARSRSQRSKIKQSASLRKKLLNVTIDDLVTDAPPTDTRVAELSDVTDISDFELRLRFYQRQAMATDNQQDEQTVESRMVELSNNYFAFLTDSFHIPVVTGYVTGSSVDEEIPQRTIAKIRSGDFLLFRESAEGNVLRTIADLGLAKSGKGHLRNVASLWQNALRAYHSGLNKKTSAVIQALRKAGCKKTDLTIRNWIFNDLLIGPRRFSDLKLIAEVTGDRELKAKLAEIRSAIREVRGAHLQASSFLVNKLLEAAPARLRETRNGFFSLEIEGVGKAVVVQVEEVGDEPIKVSYSRANRLLKESAET